MKVFLCWSGQRSKAVAEALYEWLPMVIQKLVPWMSKQSISAGQRWREEVGRELEACSFGILCITSENTKAEWIHFEAGALSKIADYSRVVPYLHELEKSQIMDPLAQFQAMKATKGDTLDLLKSLNNALTDGKLSDTHLMSQFSVWWEKLEAKLNDIAAPPASRTGAQEKRSTEDILEELVQRIRSVESMLSQMNAQSSASLIGKPGTPVISGMPGGVTAEPLGVIAETLPPTPK